MQIVVDFHSFFLGLGLGLVLGVGGWVVYWEKVLTKFLLCFVGQTNAQISRITDELSEKSEEVIRYQEEISSLLSQIVDLQHKLKEVREC